METQNDLLERPTAGDEGLPSALNGCRQGFLLAENTGSEALLIQHAFGAAGMTDSLHVVSDGETAIDYLRGCGDYAASANHLTRPIPQVVLLDSKLRGKDGFEVLSWMRMQSHFKSLIIVIFTGLNREADADRVGRDIQPVDLRR